MDSREEQELGSTLTARCDRHVRVTTCGHDSVRIVLEPTGDRGRVELVATSSDLGWTVTDRGAVANLHGLDLDFVIAKLSASGTALSRRGGELIAHTDDLTLAETVAEFVDSIEFVPVLAGLFANAFAA